MGADASQEFGHAKPPFTKSWWVSSPFLLAGCYPGDLDETVACGKLAALLDSGIRTFISLQEEDEARRFAAYEPAVLELAASRGTVVHCERFPIRDCGIPTPEFMTQILDRIDQAVEQGAPVYVHCWGGHGRTATVVGCWLVRHGAAGDDALGQIKLLRRHDPHLTSQPAPQTPEQIAFVRGWKRHDPTMR